MTPSEATTKAKLTVGQKLWFVPTERYLGTPRFITVTKLGRKWVDIRENHRWRVNAETMVVFSGTDTIGIAHVDATLWKSEKRRADEWERLLRFFRQQYQVPAGLTTDAILAAQRALGITPENQ